MIGNRIQLARISHAPQTGAIEQWVGTPPGNRREAIAVNARFADSRVIGRIDWTEATLNPVTGSRRLYAERMALRLRAMGTAKHRNGFAVTLYRATPEEPLKC